jgi:hypothetical protein
MALNQRDAIRLALLEAIEFESPTATWLELELKDTLPAAGGIAANEIDVALVQRALGTLKREGLAFSHWASNHLDEHGRPREGADQLWTITEAGAAELEALRH